MAPLPLRVLAAVAKGAAFLAALTAVVYAFIGLGVGAVLLLR